MRPTVFALPLLAATAAFAQSRPANPPVTKATPSIIPSGTASCPVGMRARQAALGQTIWTISREDAYQPRDEAVPRSGDSGVHVELNALQGMATEAMATQHKQIRQVELAVHYVPPGARILLLQPGASNRDTPGLKKTFNLSADGGAALKLSGDLLVGPSASITRVHVLRIDYSDGTAWRAAGEQQCSVAPNGFLLVGVK